MEVINNKALLVNTKYPERITNAIVKSKIVGNSASNLSRVLVNWGFLKQKL